MDRRLLELEVENFRTLKRVSLPLGPLTVLVGPNGAGKTNVLKVFDFLVDIIRTDLEPALDARGGFEHVAFWGGTGVPTAIRIKIKACWTTYSSPTAPDEYELKIRRRRVPAFRRTPDGEEPLAHRFRLERSETFQFKRTQGRGRRITISGERAQVTDTTARQEETAREIGISKLSSGLSTLPRLSDEAGGSEVATVAQKLAGFRVFDVRVDDARRPSRVLRLVESLRDDASNLAAFLVSLRERDEQAWHRLVEDARTVLPQLEGIEFDLLGGAAPQVAIVLRETGLRRTTSLADASYGTIRLLGLLALLYDPDPPALTCVEEIDHGLHPQALELLVTRLREASQRTQFIIATHSPAFADRLRPEELMVCERLDDGSSAIPAIDLAKVRAIVDASEGLPLGELWFSGALGGSV